MSSLLLWLVPIALGMGLAGLCAFLWSLKNGQLEDLDGAGERVCHQPVDAPLPAERNDNRKQ
ncbi:cbb3-type cytochrome oxidase assembly protein CcoS [Rhizobium sp. EC-SD404]|jgi:cbb3-type cytochrome oxidase maturation protein|uniref:cbb3-type cytochrome oxidase assembly protein CcoS n=1 Tax=Rhizobium sp. EC-SD404 TaxID=2038389 RepID=UPI001255A034|nr:cbb3-type cytochrome oxidase assembly protein CcoS [Rhizobium sp. EC-SD404]VVT27721.1 Cytochrome oxidase maturation protein, cbb3-type [Rhizobium sp. EC-SD404]